MHKFPNPPLSDTRWSRCLFYVRKGFAQTKRRRFTGKQAETKSGFRLPNKQTSNASQSLIKRRFCFSVPGYALDQKYSAIYDHILL